MKSVANIITPAAVVAAAICCSVAPRALSAQDTKLADRVKRAGEVLHELVSVPDNSPPKGLLDDATCVAVVPGVVQAGFVFGGRAGFGIASCRTPQGWSWPTFMGLKGGSFGLQIGAQSADVVLIFVNENAPRTISASSFDLGAGASIAAGPIGRDLSAATDYRAQAEIYSYSKSKGLFAGLKLEGTKWEIDYGANSKAYAGQPATLGGGTSSSVHTLLGTPGSRAPSIVRPFLESLEKNVGPGGKSS